MRVLNLEKVDLYKDRVKFLLPALQIAKSLENLKPFMISHHETLHPAAILGLSLFWHLRIFQCLN